MFSIFALLLLLTNFFVSGIFYDIAIFIVDTLFYSSSTHNTFPSYYPSNSDLPSIYNKKNFIIEY